MIFNREQRELVKDCKQPLIDEAYKDLTKKFKKDSEEMVKKVYDRFMAVLDEYNKTLEKVVEVKIKRILKKKHGIKS